MTENMNEYESCDFETSGLSQVTLTLCNHSNSVAKTAFDSQFFSFPLAQKFSKIENSEFPEKIENFYDGLL